QTVAETKAFFQELKEIDGVEVVICPPFTALAKAIEMTEGRAVSIAAQNLFWEEKGAYTGEISPLMLREIGCQWVLIGHSERRQYFGETDQTVNRKIKAALDAGLKPIVCIGETEDQRTEGLTEKVLETQLNGALAGFTAGEALQMVIAYEPIWAIGTGKTASAADAQQVAGWIRRWLIGYFGLDLVGEIRILYGGSVKPENTAELLQQPDIDGALVGGASLKANSLTAIIQAALLRS
ncbi:MAG: triose-phosphate isomerase, partial [Clostridia bacterium]|nr:triose-phosphate isomerase [Clostridia bacterium]